MMNYYHIYVDTSGFWRWRYVSSNGRIIADSGEGYAHKADCLHGIDLMKASFNAPVRGA